MLPVFREIDIVFRVALDLQRKVSFVISISEFVNNKVKMISLFNVSSNFHKHLNIIVNDK